MTVRAWTSGDARYAEIVRTFGASGHRGWPEGQRTCSSNRQQVRRHSESAGSSYGARHYLSIGEFGPLTSVHPSIATASAKIFMTVTLFKTQLHGTTPQTPECHFERRRCF